MRAPELVRNSAPERATTRTLTQNRTPPGDSLSGLALYLQSASQPTKTPPEPSISVPNREGNGQGRRHRYIPGWRRPRRASGGLAALQGAGTAGAARRWVREIGKASSRE